MAPDRGALLGDLAQRMSRAGDSIPGSWTGFSVVAEITALGVRVTGFRYDGDAPGLPILMDTDAIEAIADLRLASPGPAGQLFDIYVARLEHDSGAIVDQAFTTQTGAPYRVTARSVTAVAELVRPGPAYLPAAVPPPPPPPPAPEPQPAPESQPASGLNGEPQPEPHPQAGPGPQQPGPHAQPQPEPQPEPESEPAPEPEPAARPEPSPAEASVPDSNSAAERVTVSTLTADVLGWPELAQAQWHGYGGAVVFWGDVLYTVGFRYEPDGAVPTYVGGDFHQHLRAYREAQAQGREPAGAALLRLVDPHGSLQIRLVYPPASDQIRWDAPDSALAARLAPPDVPSTIVVPRVPADLLEPGALVARVRADVAASLRSRDEWTGFAMAFDVSGQRSAAFLYRADGTSEPFRTPLPVTGDLSELRDQTARPDGTRWVGVVVHSWAGSDRVDLTFWGQAGINSFLVDAGSRDGLALRPPASPPEAEPVLPWPAVGGYLDRERLLGEVAEHLWRAAALAGSDWDRLAVVVSFGAGSGVEVRGLRYLGADGPVAETTLEDLGPIGKLRRSFRYADASLPNMLVLSGRRGTHRLDVSALFGSAADELTALPTGPLIDRVRPA